MSFPRKAGTAEKPSTAFPAQYVRVPQPPVTAVQWLGDNREQVNALFVGISPRTSYVHAGADDTLVLTSAQVSATVRLGDFIVKRSERDIYLVENAAFLALYEPAGASKPAQVIAADPTPIGDQRVSFTDIAGDTLVLYKGVMGQNGFLSAVERDAPHARVSLLFTPADMRGIADTLLKLANEMEAISDGR